MKRVHIEFIMAIIIFAWVMSNIAFIKPENVNDFFAVILPILFSVVIQCVGLIIAATMEGSD